MAMKTTFGIALGVLFSQALAGCVLSTVRQSSLVPAATLPPPTDFRGTGVTVGNSLVAGVARPTLAPDTNAGLYIPRTQFEGAISVGPQSRTELRSLRVPWLVALPDGAMAGSPTTLQNPGSVAWGVGIGGAMRFLFQRERMTLDVTADLMALSVPSRLETVPSGSNPTPVVVTHDRDTTLLATLAVSVGYKLSSAVRVFSTLAGRNHPRNLANFTATTFSGSSVGMGPFNGIIGVGAEFELTRWLSVTPQVQWPFVQNPVVYAPIVSLMVSLSVPTSEAPRGDSPTPAAPATAPATVPPPVLSGAPWQVSQSP